MGTWPGSGAEAEPEPPPGAGGGPLSGLLAGSVQQLLLVEDSEAHARLVAATLAEAPGPRLGGDEFAVLCEGFRAENEIKALAARMAETIAESVVVGHQRRSVGASIGIAFATGTGETADELIRMADQAMYRKKRQAHPDAPV